MLHVADEISRLKTVCVCRGFAVPEWDGYRPTHREFTKYVHKPWDKARPAATTR